MSKHDDQYSEDEVGRRRDEVVKRMLKTLPQPRLAKRAPKAKGAQDESSVQDYVARQSEAFFRSGRRVKGLDLQKLAGSSGR